jgi:hypothetical protein
LTSSKLALQHHPTKSPRSRSLSYPSDLPLISRPTTGTQTRTRSVTDGIALQWKEDIKGTGSRRSLDPPRREREQTGVEETRVIEIDPLIDRNLEIISTVDVRLVCFIHSHSRPTLPHLILSGEAVSNVTSSSHTILETFNSSSHALLLTCTGVMSLTI